MKIIIEPQVHQAIDNFYDAAILRHFHTLSYETVENKKQRLYAGIRSLTEYYPIFGTAHLKKEWIREGCKNLSARTSILLMRCFMTKMAKK